MTDSPAIQASGIGKRYRLGTRSRYRSLIEVFKAPVRATEPANSANAAHFWALRDVSFSIANGENVGLIGLNGAGKSTSLKLLSRITEPTTGTIRINGRLGALLEVGTGFHGELTGRENVYLYGSILGMKRSEVRQKFDAIVEFAEISAFIDTPVKRYSSGMYVRLAFSVAAHLDPDILLLDEVLAVGDLPFQRKCIDYAKQLQQKDSTILFVSHNMFSIKTMCDRVIYLEKGQVKYDGPTEGGISMYEEDCRLSTLSWGDTNPSEWPIRVTACTLHDELGATQTIFDYGQRMKLRVSYRSHKLLRDLNFIISFTRSDGVVCCNYSSETDGVGSGIIDGDGMLEVTTPPLKLISELYTINILVRERGFQRLVCAQIGGTFHVRHALFDTHFGVFHEPADWEFERRPTVSHPRISESQQ